MFELGLISTGLVLGFVLRAVLWRGQCPKCLARLSDADAQLERLRSDFEWADKP